MPFSISHVTFQPNPYSILLLVIFVLAGGLAVLIWSRRQSSGAPWLALAMFAVALWCGAYALELASVDEERMLFWARVQYLGIVVVPTAWLLFALHYTQRANRVVRALLPFLVIIPVSTLLLNYTNEFHHGFYVDITVDRSGPLAVLSFEKGL